MTTLSTEASESGVVLLTEDGSSYLKRTASGNANQRIPNLWRFLISRIQKDHADFPFLSFKHLRKTAASLVREFGDGEIAAVFLCHGQAVRSDDLADVYTNRPFGKVYATLRKIEEFLKPMFDETPEDPFPAKRKKGGPNITPAQKRKITQMGRAGFKRKKIAEEVGVTTQTVYRHLKGQK